MTKVVPYITFMKHAEKITKAATNSRPVLKSVYHSDKFVAVTDSHRAYIATGIYDGEEKTIDPTTGVDVDKGRYPDLSRIKQDESNAEHKQEIDVNSVYETVRAVEIANRLTRGTV